MSYDNTKDVWVEAWDFTNEVVQETHVEFVQGEFENPLNDLGSGTVEIPATWEGLPFIAGFGELAPVVATGGTKTTVDGYVYHYFSSDDDFVVTAPGNIDFLIVGGGAGGGGAGTGDGPAGGGGSAGYVLRTGVAITPGTYPVTVGAGGEGGTSTVINPGVSDGQPGDPGEDSTFFGETAPGGEGGGGGRQGVQGLDGVAGGGGYYDNPGGVGSPGGDGGDGASGSPFDGGGGGGIGGDAPDGDAAGNPAGGIGVEVPEFAAVIPTEGGPHDNTPGWICGGGGGGRWGAGDLTFQHDGRQFGGGGCGAGLPGNGHYHGIDGTGGGGGGARDQQFGLAYPGGDGGDGGVYIRYPVTPTGNFTSLLKVFVGGKYAYSFFADLKTDPYVDEGSGEWIVTVGGEGMESVMKWARLFPYDWPADPTRSPDWNYGFDAAYFTSWETTENLLENAHPFFDEPNDDGGNALEWTSRGGADLSVIDDPNDPGTDVLEIDPSGHHSGASQAVSDITGGKRYKFSALVKGSSTGQRITLVVDYDGISTGHFTTSNVFLYAGEVLAELENVARNGSGDGCPGGETDGTWQLTEMEFDLPAGVSNVKVAIQSDHHPGCGAPGNDLFWAKEIKLVGYGAGADGWTRTGRISELTADSSKARSGDYSLKVTTNSVNDSHWFQSPDINVSPGATYRMVGYFDSENPVEILADVVDPETGDYALLTVSPDGVTTVPGQWTQVAVTFTVPSDFVSTVAIRWALPAGTEDETLWVDDTGLFTGLPPTSPGQIVLDMLAEAQDRGTITWVKTDFDGDVDSNGDAWTIDALAYNFGHGQTLYEVLQQLVAQGFEWTVEPDDPDSDDATGMTLRMYNARTDDDPNFGKGTNYSGDAEPFLTDGAIIAGGQGTIRLGANVVLAEGGEAVAGQGRDLQLVFDATLGVGIGRREDFISNAFALDADTLSGIASGRLRNIKQSGVAAAVELPRDAEGVLPIKDFRLGDTINADLGTRLPDDAYRVAAIRFRFKDHGDDRWVADLGRIIVPLEAITAQRLARIEEQRLVENASPGSGFVSGQTSGVQPILVVGEVVGDHTHSLDDDEITGKALDGDLTGSLPDRTKVVRLQGYRISSTAPGTGQVWKFNPDDLIWYPHTLVSFGGDESDITSTPGPFVGDLWVDTDDNSLWAYDGLDWIQVGGGGGGLPLTTKGDLLAHDGTSSDRLPVGTDGQVLAADSGETLGVAWVDVPVELMFACSDEGTAIDSTGTKLTFRMPFAMTVTEVRASLNGACTTGTFTVDVNEGGVSILSTKVTIDATEKTSTTATTAAVISDADLADDAEMTVDVDDDGDGTATGLKVTLIGTRA